MLCYLVLWPQDWINTTTTNILKIVLNGKSLLTFHLHQSTAQEFNLIVSLHEGTHTRISHRHSWFILPQRHAHLHFSVTYEKCMGTDLRFPQNSGKTLVQTSLLCVGNSDRQPNQTRVTSYIQTDLAGLLPTSLVDSALPSNQINFFTSLKAALASRVKPN